jgi:ATP-binding cassette subfamily B protein
VIIMSLHHSTERREPFRAVLGFVFRLWGRQRLRVALAATAMMAATAADLFLPLYAGRLVDAVALGGERGLSPALAPPKPKDETQDSPERLPPFG